MTSLRSLSAVARLVCLILATLGCYLSLLAGSGVLLLAGRDRLAWKTHVQSIWGRIGCALLGMRLELDGAAPDPPFVLAANHVGYTDVFALAAVTRGVFVAKAEIASWPILGAICRSANTLFIDRQRMRDVPRVMSDLLGILRQGQGILLFAEAQTSDGRQILPLRSPLLEVAVIGRYGVYGATLCYETDSGAPPAGRVVPWIGGAHLIVHIYRLLCAGGVRARITLRPLPEIPPDRKQLARELWGLMNRSFTPIRG